MGLLDDKTRRLPFSGCRRLGGGRASSTFGSIIICVEHGRRDTTITFPAGLEIGTRGLHEGTADNAGWRRTPSPIRSLTSWSQLVHSGGTDGACNHASGKSFLELQTGW